MDTNLPSLVVAFVLDESGSMVHATSQTIAGVNQYVQSLKEQNKDKKVLFSLTKFSSEVTVLHTAEYIEDIPGIDGKYSPNGSTALFDAVGETITETAKRVSNGTPVLVVVMTDGQENASLKYSHAAIKSLIEEKKSKNWSFVFLGEGEDKWIKEYGNSLGFAQSISYDSCDMKDTLRSVSSGTRRYVASASAGNDADLSAKAFSRGFDMDCGNLDDTKTPEALNE